MKALHNSALSKLESWAAHVYCITVLTGGVTLTKGTRVTSPTRKCIGRRPSLAWCTCVAALPASGDFLLGNCSASAYSRLETIGKLYSHTARRVARARCIRLSNKYWAYTAFTQSADPSPDEAAYDLNDFLSQLSKLYYKLSIRIYLYLQFVLLPRDNLKPEN